MGRTHHATPRPSTSTSTPRQHHQLTADLTSTRDPTATETRLTSPAELHCHCHCHCHCHYDEKQPNTKKRKGVREKVWHGPRQQAWIRKEKGRKRKRKLGKPYGRL